MDSYGQCRSTFEWSTPTSLPAAGWKMTLCWWAQKAERYCCWRISSSSKREVRSPMKYIPSTPLNLHLVCRAKMANNNNHNHDRGSVLPAMSADEPQAPITTLVPYSKGFVTASE